MTSQPPVTFPFRTTALKLTQRLTTYYVAVIPAGVLLETCFSERLRATAANEQSGYRLEGTQRILDDRRLNEIGAYIARYDSAFPNSIILAANFRDQDGLLEEDEALRWSIKEEGNECTLEIPTSAKLASVIDGQHRLFAFQATALPPSEKLNIPLICSIFFDLQKPYQAQLFATINSTQKPVDKSLTYELFGYNLNEESEEFWSPDKLAVFIARKLNVEADSPFHHRIVIAPQNEFISAAPTESSDWKISMAPVVEGVLKLISSNPKRDTTRLLTPERKKRSSLDATQPADRSPLRKLYLEGNDKIVYLIVNNYFTAVQQVFFANAKPGSFIRKTVGIQALFEILKKISPGLLERKNISISYFVDYLSKASDIDFADPEYTSSSASGRATIRKAIEKKIGLE